MTCTVRRKGIRLKSDAEPLKSLVALSSDVTQTLTQESSGETNLLRTSGSAQTGISDAASFFIVSKFPLCIILRIDRHVHHLVSFDRDGYSLLVAVISLKHAQDKNIMHQR